MTQLPMATGYKPPQETPATLAGSHVLVVGLGRFGGGVGVTRWLVDQRAHVTVTDLAEASTLADSMEALAGLPVSFRFGRHDPEDLRGVDLVVMNPAIVKHKSDFFAEILRRRLPWTTEMNLFCERCPAAVVGVTGSFGKSTTCAMLADVLARAATARLIPYREVHLGGNIGRSLLPELARMTSYDLVVLEMSNAQLEDLPRIRWMPRWSAITNLFPHHLDRHGAFEAYIDVKLNILRLPSPMPDGHSPSFPAREDGRDPISTNGPSSIIVGDLHPDAERRLLSAIGGRTERLKRCSEWPEAWPLTVPGAHNRRNAGCVMTLCNTLGIPGAFTREALQAFTGLPHRLQHVRNLGGVDFYNDSKSTSPSATRVAIESFTQPVVVILGGQAKNVDLHEWAGVVCRACRAAVCTGEAGPGFAAALRAVPADRPLVVLEVHSLDEAVRRASELARAGDAVLFSPGAPSFDHYVNFEARGLHFVSIVNQMAS